MKHGFIFNLIIFLLAFCVNVTAFACCSKLSQNASIDDVTQIAECLIEHERYDKAIDVLKKQKNESETNANLLRLLGQAHNLNGQTQKSLDTLEQAYSLNPQDIRIVSTLSSVLFKRGLEISPVQVYGRVRSLPPECQPTQAEIEQVDKSLSYDHIKRAYELSDEVAEYFQDNPLRWADQQAVRGMMLIELGEFDRGIAAQDKAALHMLSHAGGDPNAEFMRNDAAMIYSNIASQLWLVNRHQEAREYADRAVKAVPNQNSKDEISGFMDSIITAQTTSKGEALQPQTTCLETSPKSR